MLENCQIWWKHWYQCCEVNFRGTTIIARECLQPCWKSYFSWIPRLRHSSYLTMGGVFTDKGLIHVRGSGPWNDVWLAQNTGHLSILNMFVILPQYCRILSSVMALVSPFIAAPISSGCSTVHVGSIELIALMYGEFSFHTIHSLKAINWEQFLVSKGTIHWHFRFIKEIKRLPRSWTHTLGIPRKGRFYLLLKPRDIC